LISLELWEEKQALTHFSMFFVPGGGVPDTTQGLNISSEISKDLNTSGNEDLLQRIREEESRKQDIERALQRRQLEAQLAAITAAREKAEAQLAAKKNDIQNTFSSRRFSSPCITSDTDSQTPAPTHRRKYSGISSGNESEASNKSLGPTSQRKRSRYISDDKRSELDTESYKDDRMKVFTRSVRRSSSLRSGHSEMSADGDEEDNNFVDAEEREDEYAEGGGATSSFDIVKEKAKQTAPHIDEVKKELFGSDGLLMLKTPYSTKPEQELTKIAKLYDDYYADCTPQLPKTFFDDLVKAVPAETRELKNAKEKDTLLQNLTDDVILTFRTFAINVTELENIRMALVNGIRQFDEQYEDIIEPISQMDKENDTPNGDGWEVAIQLMELIESMASSMADAENALGQIVPHNIWAAKFQSVAASDITKRRILNALMAAKGSEEHKKKLKLEDTVWSGTRPKKADGSFDISKPPPLLLPDQVAPLASKDVALVTAFIEARKAEEKAKKELFLRGAYRRGRDGRNSRSGYGYGYGYGKSRKYTRGRGGYQFRGGFRGGRGGYYRNWYGGNNSWRGGYNQQNSSWQQSSDQQSQQQQQTGDAKNGQAPYPGRGRGRGRGGQ
jgi:hypothetical protein